MCVSLVRSARSTLNGVSFKIKWSRDGQSFERSALKIKDIVREMLKVTDCTVWGMADVGMYGRMMLGL